MELLLHEMRRGLQHVDGTACALLLCSTLINKREATQSYHDWTPTAVSWIQAPSDRRHPQRRPHHQRLERTRGEAAGGARVLGG